MNPELERLHRLCLEGDVKAEGRLFELLRRRGHSPYPTGGKTPHEDIKGQPINIGDYVIHHGSSAGLVVGYTKQRIQVVFTYGIERNRSSPVSPRNCVSLPPQAFEGRVWAKPLQDYREVFFGLFYIGKE